MLLQLREAAAAALARMHQEKAQAEPAPPSLEERVSGGVHRLPGMGTWMLRRNICAIVQLNCDLGVSEVVVGSHEDCYQAPVGEARAVFCLMSLCVS
jgi:hypothetical protein